MRSNKRLAPEEFEALRPHLERLGERNIDGARAIMVDGRPQKQVAAAMGVSKATASAFVCRVWEAHIAFGTRPPGWVNVSVTLPPDLAELVKDMERKARDKYRAEA